MGMSHCHLRITSRFIQFVIEQLEMHLEGTPDQMKRKKLKQLMGGNRKSVEYRQLFHITMYWPIIGRI